MDISMMNLWTRYVRWLARKEIAVLNLQLALSMAENSMLKLNHSLLDLQNNMAALTEKQLENSEDQEKKRTLH